MKVVGLTRQRRRHDTRASTILPTILPCQLNGIQNLEQILKMFITMVALIRQISKAKPMRLL